MGMSVIDMLEVCLVLKEIELLPQQRKILEALNFKPAPPLELARCENCTRRTYVTIGTKIYCNFLRSYVFGNCICNKYSKR